MWRKCDFHRHTTPDASGEFNFDARDFLLECVRDGLDVVAVTDHDQTDHIDAVVAEAANHDITVVPGVGISTDRGHILALSPGNHGRTILDELCGRIPGFGSPTVEFNRLTGVLSEQRANRAGLFRNHVVLIGAHADRPGSILASQQAPSLGDQVSKAQQLQALEVVDEQNLADWRKGIKQTEVIMPLLQGSDAHPTVDHKARSTWIYLPEVSPQCLRHAFATHEASISQEQQPPIEPDFWIKSIRFEGGQYDGRRINFSPRANALIGPPSSGKSLIVDAIRWAFDLPCAINDVQSSIDRRLTKCLPDGTTVVVELEGGDNNHELRRVRGGTNAPDTEVKPIVFSQAELSRRSMEPIPSVALLDIHCPQGEVHKQGIAEVSDKVHSAFLKIVALATQARVIRLKVGNEQEGLEATRSKYFNLVGDEDTARSLGDLGRIETWHKVARERLEEWRRTFVVPAGPELPTVPQLHTDLPIADYLPSNAAPAALVEYDTTVSKAADELVATLQKESTTRYPQVEALRGDIQASLGGEQHATPELAGEAEQFRTRLATLEQEASDLAKLDKKIADDLAAIDALIDQATKSWTDLRQARRMTCTAVNTSMPSFFVRLNPDNLTEDIDQLLNDLRTGTYLHEASLRAIRNVLDRKSFVRAAIRHVQFPISGDDQEDLDEASTNAQKIARESMDRKNFDGIAQLAVLWPRDGIEILRKQTVENPVPFDSLTEGLKALAIKEISFAASQLPAVTDQPEDAVPTTAIFESLVPTVREQRAFRQFIIASHDANVVVSGDMEQVIVLPAEASEQPIVGTLFDAPIRESAITLLEGGNRAFELRRKRYGDYA
jgi:hypothetical protein